MSKTPSGIEGTDVGQVKRCFVAFRMLQKSVQDILKTQSSNRMNKIKLVKQCLLIGSHTDLTLCRQICFGCAPKQIRFIADILSLLLQTTDVFKPTVVPNLRCRV